MAIAALAPLAGGDWDARKARHLLNRAGFGIPQERVNHLATLTPAKAVAALVDYDEIPAAPRKAPDFVLTAGDVAEIRKEDPDEVGKAERRSIAMLRGWWLQQMMETHRPLEEKLALFWHGHFATSAQKVRSSWMTYDLNRTFRTHASGNAKALTLAVAQSGSMLRYLDNNRNVKGKPNENWARELMELFTLGVGNYTENDIKESARAFTGWTYDRKGFNYRENLHDFGTKTFMGRTGNLDGWNVIDIIFEQPVAAEFLCKKLWTFFAYEDPEPEIVKALAGQLRESNYEVRPVLRTLFASRAFYSERAMGSQIKSPAQFILQLAYDLRLENPPYNAMAQMTSQIGQNLLHPPNVKGWDGGRAWINANTLLLRYNMPEALVRATNNMKPAADSMMMSSGNEMATPNVKSRQEQLAEYMEEMPPGERKMLRQRLAAAGDRKEKVRVMTAALENRPLSSGSWKPSSLAETLTFTTVGECVDELAQHLLARPLEPKQRAIVAKALSADGLGAPLDPKSLSEKQLASAIHLLLSTAEYQLC